MAAYGYTRVSGESQAHSGLGLSAQAARIRDYCTSHRPRLTLEHLFTDRAVSGRTPFIGRLAGRRLDERVVKGDHVVIAKLDRAFRNLADCAAMLTGWHERGVHVHLLDIGISTDTPTGELIAGVMGAVAQWESRRIGERIAEAKAVLRHAGRTTNGLGRCGYRVVRKRLVPDPRQRAIGRLVIRLRRRRMLWREIAFELERRRLRTHSRQRWSKQGVWRAYHAAIHRWQWSEKELRKLGHLPSGSRASRRRTVTGEHK